jgi:hypothetical protein
MSWTATKGAKADSCMAPCLKFETWGTRLCVAVLFCGVLYE